MPWVRIDPNADDHPKVGNLPDGAFRLWFQGLCHCQKHLTDGYVSDGAVRLLRAYSPKRLRALVDAGLWEQSESGYRVHDYLDWNESREHVMTARAYARDRLRKHREKRTEKRVTARECNAYTPVSSVSVQPQASEVGEGGSGETTPEGRAGAFCRWYEDTHERLFRVGYMGTQTDYTHALRLVAKFSDQELQDAALVWFGQDDAFATSGTRTIAKFASRVTGCLQLVREQGIA